jgi:S1-C subfamily serine protease
LNAQSLGAQRVTHLKNCTVRILINGSASGTGFVVTQDGLILTCFHVIEPALRGKFKTEVEFSNGEVVEALFPNYLMREGLRESLGYDCMILVPSFAKKVQHEFLNVGQFSDVEEGDQLVTVGYPLAVKQPIISVGFLSTKWHQVSPFLTNGKADSLQRDVAWLDMTMNRGNSGGAIIRLGTNPTEDKVIGIATFILNPYGPIADQLLGAVNNSQVDISMGGISQNGVTKLLASAVANNSIGVSGCISIDHIVSLFKKANDPLHKVN